MSEIEIERPSAEALDRVGVRQWSISTEECRASRERTARAKRVMCSPAVQS